MARNAGMSVLRSLQATAMGPAATLSSVRSITGWNIYQREKGKEWRGLPAVDKASYQLLAKGEDLQDFLDISAGLKAPKKKTPAYIESLVVQSKANAIIAAAVEEDKLKKKQKQEATVSAVAALPAEQQLQDAKARLLKERSLSSALEFAKMAKSKAEAMQQDRKKQQEKQAAEKNVAEQKEKQNEDGKNKESPDAKDAASDKTDKVVSSAAESEPGMQELQSSKEDKASSRKPFKVDFEKWERAKATAKSMQEDPKTAKETIDEWIQAKKKEQEAAEKKDKEKAGEKESPDAKDAASDTTDKEA